jgi:hypothetical protein
MKLIITKTFGALAILAAVNTSAAVGAETIDTRIGKLSFTHGFTNGYPTKETVENLYDERDFQRACQAYLWGLPIVAFAQWQEQSRAVFGAGDLDFMSSKGYEEVSGILTANVTTPYIGSFPDLAKTGPLVIDVPAGAVAGMVDDFWQRPVTDLRLAGPGRAQGLREKLDSVRARARLVCLFPSLCPHRSAFQPDMDAAGFREGEVTSNTSAKETVARARREKTMGKKSLSVLFYMGVILLALPVWAANPPASTEPAGANRKAGHWRKQTRSSQTLSAVFGRSLFSRITTSWK